MLSALFNVLRFPINVLPQVISNLVDAHVSVKRLDKYLLSDELDPNAVERHQPRSASKDNSLAIKIENGTFRWDTNSAQPTLRNINVEIR